MKPKASRLFRACFLAAAAVLVLAPGLKAQLPNPLINVDANTVTESSLSGTATVANTGSLGGTFDTDGTTVAVETTSGKQSFTFTGSNRLKASFTSPAGIAGNGTYTVVATVLNPAIAGEEAYLSWSRRFPALGFNAAQFNYGSDTGFGAVTHWGNPDMGFSSVPPANLWHTIAVTFDGTTEKVYVNGVLDAQENKTLNMYQGDPIFIGCSFNRNNLEQNIAPELGFSGSVASVKVYDDALNAAQVREASGFVLVTGQVTTGSEALSRAAVSYAATSDSNAAPLGTALTDASGNYSLGVPASAGTIYVRVAADGYQPSDYSELAVGTADIGGVNFSMTLLPPLVDINANGLAAGTLTSWSNAAGSLGGSFSPDGTSVSVSTVAGKTAVNFSGSNRMKLVSGANANINAPATITGNSGFTVLARLYNPDIAAEEAYLTWAQRGTTARCGQFNFGSAGGFGAAAHWGDLYDIGFGDPKPTHSTWHWIAMTFDGVTERIYLNGTLNNSEAKTLDLWPDQPFMLGASYGNADGTGVGQNFSGSIAALKIYGGALTQSQITALLSTVTISGQVSSGGSPVAGATVAYKLSANALNSPLGTTLTDNNGNYTFSVDASSGTYYIAATKTGFFPSADTSTTVANTNIPGVNFSLEARPTISGSVSNNASELLPSAAVTVNTSTDGGTTLTPVQTVYADPNGNYLAYVDKNTTYYLTVSKSTHSAGSPATVGVATSNVIQNLTLTKLPRVLLVDLQATDLPSGTQTTSTKWPNKGTLGGDFTANNSYPVTTVGVRKAVDFTGTTDIAFDSSWQTSAVPWPSSLANSGDVQYSVVGWIQAPVSTGTFLAFSNGTATVPNRTFNSSWMFFRYNGNDAWGAADHGFSNWVGWTGTNTSSPASFPPVNNWHMIVHTYDGKSQKLYVDGVKQSTSGAEGIIRTFNSTSTVMRLGRDIFNNSPFKGYIHRVQVFDQPLSQADVSQLWSYQSWSGGYNFATGADTSPAGNPDGDTLNNLLEFAFGTDPAATSVGPITYAAGSVTGRGQPTTQITNLANSVDFRAVFGRRKDYLAAGLTYTVQFSAGLDIWQDSTATPEVLASDSEIDAVSVPYPLFITTSRGVEKPQFFRVRVNSTNGSSQQP